MSVRYTISFKEQAVAKALSRGPEKRIKDIASELGVGYSSLQKWIRQSGKQELSSVVVPGGSSSQFTEKKPQDWSSEERLDMVMRCSSLDVASVSSLCREQGIYPHHVKQWKLDLVSKSTGPSQSPSELKNLRAENKALKKELRRKEKALAETAALLVLQKKVNEIWGMDDGDN